jgi:predicted dehydrogenase
VTYGTFGLGGYAGYTLELLSKRAAAEPHMSQLLAVCEPDHTTHAKKIEDLRARGIKVFDNPQELFAQPVDAVWLPLPIDLHRKYMEMALDAGKAVLCEKPAAGAVDDVDAMTAARDRADLPVAIGFQDIYDTRVLALKKRLVSGELGQIESAGVIGLWPRDDGYFGRNGWAGALKRNGVWVLDSPANNAMAHFVNLSLFLVGPTLYESATPVAIEAELYRGNDIENYDTCSLRVELATGVKLLVLMSHATAVLHDPTIEVKVEDTREVVEYRDQDRRHMHDRFTNLVAGRPDDRPVATLEMARNHTLLINGASEAAKVVSVPESSIERLKGKGANTLRSIRRLDTLMKSCFAKGRMLHESGLANWTVPAGSKDLRGYKQFNGVKE